MNVHVSLTGEPNQAYANMIALLLYSLRKNGGELSDVHVTVSTNGEEMPGSSRRELERLGPVTCRVMPRQHGGKGFVNKFNALYAPSETYDVLLFLDCDTIVFRPLDGIVSGMNPEKAQFRARIVGPPGSQKAGPLEPLIQKYALSEEYTLTDVADDRFPGGYPFFNAGVMAMTRPAVKMVRRDASRIAYELYAERARTTKDSALEMMKEVGRRVKKRLISDASQSTYAFWITDQLGIALSLIKNQIEYDVLSPYFNWVYPHEPENEDLPAIFHYMSGRHPQVDRQRLFNGEWQKTYLTGASLPRKSLAELAREYESMRRS
jgi:hypothetical protein